METPIHWLPVFTPKFPFKRKQLLRVASKSKLVQTWKGKVRASMRAQALPDCVEYLDVHGNIDRVCRQLSRDILKGEYVPRSARPILVEKSKGLCRLMVVPHFRDAIVLESLSESFWQQVKSSAPTPNAFFEPEDHKFTKGEKDDYGPLHAWLNFQEKIFNFSNSRNFIVVTDIANYYDFINHGHLRNVISSIAKIDETILDCLIFILSELLWRPDYMPRYNVGLPQMNINAPRLLAHCFLYELDRVMHAYSSGDYVRYMDDIDVGVDTVNQAKHYIRDLDLVLQSRHLRLNSGKTKILSSVDARRHFKIEENLLLDRMEEKIKLGKYPLAARANVFLRVYKACARRRVYDDGNGDKILKRLLKFCKTWDAFIGENDVYEIIHQRPAVRNAALRYRSHFVFSIAFADRIRDYIGSGSVVDDATLVDVATCIVDMRVSCSPANQNTIRELSAVIAPRGYFGALSALWILSKYGDPQDIYRHIRDKCLTWKGDWAMARMIGGMSPRLFGSIYHNYTFNMIIKNSIDDAFALFEFHRTLGSEPKQNMNVINVVAAPNTSSPCKITHSKFLVLLSLSRNASLDPSVLAKLKKGHSFKALDGFYANVLPKGW